MADRYRNQPYQRRSPRASPARAQTKGTDTVQGVRPRGYLTKGCPVVQSAEEEPREGDLLIFEYCATEPGKGRVVRPDIFACHETIVLRRPCRARVGVLPPQIKALV